MKHYVFIRRLPKDAVWGGCEKRLLNYFAAADPQMVRITLVTNNDIFSLRVRERPLAVEIVDDPLPIGGGPRAGFRAMLALLKRLRPQSVVFVQGSFLDFSLAEFWAGFLMTRGNVYSLEVLGAPDPVIKTSGRHFGKISGLGIWWYQDMLGKSLRGWLCRRILAVSHEVKDRMVTLYRYPASRIQVVFGGVDLQLFAGNGDVRRVMRERLGILPHEPVIISTARMSKEKCLDRLVAAFSRIVKIQPDCWLVLIGDGPRREDLLRMVESLGVKARVKYLGFQSDVGDYLKMSDIFVLPSENEGIATALLEAMACGLVCVATKTPGPKELIQDGGNGFLVDKSEEGVLTGLRKALELKVNEREFLGRQARQLIVDRFELGTSVRNAVGLLGMRGSQA